MESHFWDELINIPLLIDVSSLYRKTKKQNWIIGTGLEVIEASCTKIYATIHSTGPGSALDDYAGDCVAYWKENYPLIQQPSNRIWRKIKYRTSKRIRKGSGAILGTLPGQVALYGFDTAVNITDRIRNTLEPVSADLRMHVISVKDKSTQVTSRTRTSQSSPAKILQTNGQAVSPNKSRSNRVSKYGVEIRDVTRKTTVEIKMSNFPSLLYQVNLYLPLELYVIQLKILQAYLHSLPGVESLGYAKTGLTPEKIAEINSRRKVSPRKRIRQTFLGNVTNAACALFGLREITLSLRQTDIRQFLTIKGVSRYGTNRPDSPEKKRKHDDIVSDDSDEDFENLDLQTYQSDEDPDYQPASDGNSTDSLEYQEGDTESDIEFEETEHGSMQVKDRTGKTPGREKPIQSVTPKPGQVIPIQPVKSLEQVVAKGPEVPKQQHVPAKPEQVVAKGPDVPKQQHAPSKPEQVVAKGPEVPKQQHVPAKPEQSKSVPPAKSKESVTISNSVVPKDGVKKDTTPGGIAVAVKDNTKMEDLNLMPEWKKTKPS